MRHFLTCMLSCIALVGCGGGGGSSSGLGSGSSGSTPSNVQAVTVDAGPTGLGQTSDVNLLFTNVTICAPGTTTCQTIDHIQVDTGSSGLRILASALTTVTLPLLTSGQNALLECTQFVDGSSWGPLRTADVKIAGESAAAQIVQVIGESDYATPPSGCVPSGGMLEDTVAAFGANGVLGVGPFIQDCGPGCATTTSNGIYYVCSSNGNCQQTTNSQQVSNPVAAFAADNNGVIIELPAVAASGASTVSGSLIFGIGTQANNGLGSAQVYTVSTDNGSLITTFSGSTLNDSFIDSGSNAFYFPDSSIPTCASNSSAPGFFCPTSTLSLTATLQGQNGTSASVSFSVANANSLFSGATPVTAASNLGAPNTATTGFNSSSTFDWGLPFYYGRNVFTAIEQHNTSAGQGPFFAF